MVAVSKSKKPKLEVLPDMIVGAFNIDDLFALIKKARKIIQVDVDCLTESHTEPSSGDITPLEVKHEILAMRRWIKQADLQLSEFKVYKGKLKAALRAAGKRQGSK